MNRTLAGLILFLALPLCAQGQDAPLRQGILVLPLMAVSLRVPQPATLDTSGGEPRLLFDPSVRECPAWRFSVPANFQETPVLELIYGMVSSATGNIAFEVAVRNETPMLLAIAQLEATMPLDACRDRETLALTRHVVALTHGLPMEQLPFDIAITQTATVPQTLGHWTKASIPLLHTADMAACHVVELRVCRAAKHHDDSAMGALALASAMLRYQAKPTALDMR